MILIDTPKEGFCHMAGSSIEELHEFASKVGIKRCWYQNKKGKKQPHYDVRSFHLHSCLHLGAIKVTRSELFKFIRTTYTPELAEA